MKKRRIALVLLFCFAVSLFSGFAVSAEGENAAEITVSGDGSSQKSDLTPADVVKQIANSLAMFARYPEVDQKSLYEAAITEALNNNPLLFESVMRAMVSSIDENSAYYNAEEAKKLFDSLEDQITGIGVTVISSDKKIIVSQPMKGSPAEKAGIRAGDIIVEANGTDLRGMDLDSAVEYIRGPIGTSVTLKILRGGSPTPISVSVKREKVVSESATFEVVEAENKTIGKINFNSFTHNSAESFRKALSEADKKGIKNIIIDLRNNGGGYLDQAIEIADLFLPKDAIITTEDHKMPIFNKVYRASGKGKEYNVVILINGMSASSSEVLTAALKENGAAKVIGENSFGKGTVQTLANARDGAVVKYTSAYYLTPLGNNIHKLGIAPHAVVKNSTKPVDLSEYKMFAMKNKYKVGDKNEEIKEAKRMLELMGLYIGEINESYDESMKTAVKNFQLIKGLFPYGVLDITTQYSLYQTLSELEIEVDDQLTAAIDAFAPDKK